MNTVDHDWDRSFMWIDILGEDYMHADKNKKKKMKAQYAEERGLKPFQITGAVELGNFSKAVESLKKAQVPAQSWWSQPVAITTMDMIVYDDYPKKKKEETPMRTHEQEQKDYLARRLDNSQYTKFGEAEVEFGLSRPHPKNVKEVIQFIKDGNYTMDEKYEARNYYDFIDYVLWGTKKADHEGYGVVREKIEKAQTAAKDTIMVGTAAEGLKALQDFESTTFH